ncbi:MAG: flippase-like domain-containing protein [Erysipelothrix sp.]|nr:flippase-like domain-containing protein [Erysipelothrix sp.]
MEKIKKLLKNPIINLAIILSLSSLAMYLTMRDDFGSVLKAILSVHPFWYLLLGGWVLAHQVVMGIILTKITRSIKPKYGYFQGFVNSISTSFFNGISPGATGGQLSLLYLNSKQNITTSESTSIMWFDFMVYQAAMSITIFLLLVFGRKYFWSHHGNLMPFIIAGFVVSVGIVVGLWAITKFSWAYNFISTTGVKIGSKLRIIKNKEKVLKNLDAQINNFEVETKRYKDNPKLTIQVFSLNVLRNLMHFVFPFIVILVIVPDVKLTLMLPAMTLMACIDLIDVFFIVPGAAGMTEYLFDLLYGGLFLSTGLNLALVSSVLLIWRFFSYYFIMICGSLTFIGFKLFHYQKIK